MIVDQSHKISFFSFTTYEVSSPLICFFDHIAIHTHICTVVPSVRRAIELSDGPNLIGSFLSLFGLILSPNWSLCATECFTLTTAKVTLQRIQKQSRPTHILNYATTMCASILYGCWCHQSCSTLSYFSHKRISPSVKPHLALRRISTPLLSTYFRLSFQTIQEASFF